MPGPLSPGIKFFAVLQVATWGVFKRPSNISEHYGGGRTIPAGTKLETEEQAAARRARMAAVLQRWALAAMFRPLYCLAKHVLQALVCEDKTAAGRLMCWGGEASSD